MRQHIHIDTHKLQCLDIRPHYVCFFKCSIRQNLKTMFFILFFLQQMTRRYAEFSTSLLKISESMPSPRLNIALTQLQIELQNFILRLASEFAQRKDQLISLINNYDLMLSVIAVFDLIFNC